MNIRRDNITLIHMQAAKKIMVAKLRKEEKININKLAYLYEVIFLVNKVSLG